jgi:hypothetical protein
MMLPSTLGELLEELEFELPRSAIELSMKDEIIDWADPALVEEDVPDVVPEELEVLPIRALSRLWNTELKLEVTLLEAPKPPSMLPSNSLLADSLARPVSAATVEAVLAVKLAVEFEVLLALAATVFSAEAALDALKRLDTAVAWLLLMLPIDIMAPTATAGIRAIGRDS